LIDNQKKYLIKGDFWEYFVNQRLRLVSLPLSGFGFSDTVRILHLDPQRDMYYYLSFINLRYDSL
jgi:hypothetical protein